MRKKSKNKVDYSEAVAEYQTGLYTIKEIADRHKLNYGNFRQYISRQNVTKCNKIEHGVKAVEMGIKELKTAQNEAKCNNNLSQCNKAILKGFEYLERYGEFGAFAVALGKRVLAKGDEILEQIENARDFKSVASGIKDGFEILGLTPKNPIIIQQNNALQSQNANTNNLLQIEFIDSDIAEAEIIDDEKNTTSKMD